MNTTRITLNPADTYKAEDNDILNAAFDVFEHWYEPQANTAKYLGLRIFPLGSIDSRIDQSGVVVTQTIPGKSDNLSSVRVNQRGEVLVAESHYTFVVQGENLYVRLGSIIHLLWSFLGIVRAVQEAIEYVGNYYICVSLTNTQGTYLGHYAREFRNQDPLSTQYFWSPQSNDPLSQQANVRVCREDVDTLRMRAKEQPGLLRSVAREIARAFNQREALCFSGETAELPDELWPAR